MNIDGDEKKKITAALLWHKIRLQRARTMYVRDIFSKLKVFGKFYYLLQELREADPDYHFQYLR